MTYADMVKYKVWTYKSGSDTLYYPEFHKVRIVNCGLGYVSYMPINSIGYKGGAFTVEAGDFLQDHSPDTSVEFYKVLAKLK